MGMLTQKERYNQVIDIWGRTNNMLTELSMKRLREDQQGFNSVHDVDLVPRIQRADSPVNGNAWIDGKPKNLMQEVEKLSKILSFQILKKDYQFLNT